MCLNKRTKCIIDIEKMVVYADEEEIPIKINSIIDGDMLYPCHVCEMHFGKEKDKLILFITPEIVG